MRSTTSPGRKSTGLPTLSVVPGNVPGASSQRTKPVTVYLPLLEPVAVVIIQFPPPVTAFDVPPPPAGARNVPDPVSVIVSGTARLFLADAWPPGLTVAPGNDRLTMSHRTFVASRSSASP